MLYPISTQNFLAAKLANCTLERFDDLEPVKKKEYRRAVQRILRALPKANAIAARQERVKMKKKLRGRNGSPVV